MQKSGAGTAFSGGHPHGAPSWSGPTTSSTGMSASSSAMSTHGPAHHNQGSMHFLTDPRRRELLESRMEARFSDRAGGLVMHENNNQASGSSIASIATNDSTSNLSTGSHHSDQDHLIANLDQTPEKSRTPSGGERKRKRKNPDLQDPNSGQGKSSRNDTNNAAKKINEYFKSGSPGRGNCQPGTPGGGQTQPFGGAKSPSPQAPHQMYPQSPQNQGNLLAIQFPQSPQSQGNFANLPNLQNHTTQDFPTNSSPYVYINNRPNSQVKDTAIQTDMTCLEIQSMEVKSASELEKKNTAITELERQNEELKRQLTAQQKLIDKHKDNIKKCIDVTKKLLVEKSAIEKRSAKKKKVPTATLR